MDISFAGLILIIILVCVFWSAIMTLKRIINKALLKAEEAVDSWEIDKD